jgi:hypothetical protein
MAVLAETITALQLSLMSLNIAQFRTQRTLSEIWFYHQRIALSSAILSSLWAPVIYYPLSRWWQRIGSEQA